MLIQRLNRVGDSSFIANSVILYYQEEISLMNLDQSVLRKLLKSMLNMLPI